MSICLVSICLVSICLVSICLVSICHGIVKMGSMLVWDLIIQWENYAVTKCRTHYFVTKCLVTKCLVTKCLVTKGPVTKCRGSIPCLVAIY